MASFVVEDGSGKSNANALITIVEADEINSNYGASTDWTGATQAQKENAIREATRYLNLHYSWYGYKTEITQALQWPRFNMYDEDNNAINSDVIPDRIKEACFYLALKSIEGDTLLEDFERESAVKRTKDVIGPITEEREYVGGESPEKTYQLVDKLVTPFIINGWYGTDVERA